jgi:hypothetical protein
MKVKVTMDVPVDAPHNYAGRDVHAGEELYVFTEDTFGCIDTSVGIAMSENGEKEYPFFEFPREALDLP